MSTTTKHIVAFALPIWGHTRPLINLVGRLVKLRPVAITLLTTSPLYDRATTELARSFEPGEEEAASRVTIVSIGDTDIMQFEKRNAEFVVAWKSITEEKEIVCDRTGTRFSELPKPKAIMLDFFAREPFLAIKALTGDTIKVFAWYPAMVTGIFPVFGPPEFGGPGNIRLQAEEEARRSGRTYREVVIELIMKGSGRIVRVPSVPPMYDYELTPQDWEFPEDVAVQIFPRAFETLESVDGILLFTPESYEPEAVANVKQWYDQTGRGSSVYACGPLLPSASRATAQANESKLSKEATEIQAFLDETLAQSGEKSLLYISFGSMLWPATAPQNIWAFLDVVMELNIPFILSHASSLAVVSDEVKEKVKKYGKGVLSPWTPQQLILDHPATGWFVAHGGHNGVTEAISAGVPQILWPFTGDQPNNAIHITENLGMGYELLEVRTGHGLKTIYRTGYTPKGTIEAVKKEAREVLTKAFGSDGAEKRAKLEEVRKSVVTEWEDGGKSKEYMIDFLDKL